MANSTGKALHPSRHHFLSRDLTVTEPEGSGLAVSVSFGLIGSSVFSLASQPVVRASSFFLGGGTVRHMLAADDERSKVRQAPSS